MGTGLLTPEYLANFETEMKVVSGTDYDRLTSELWWPRITKTRTSGARRDILMWLLATAKLEYGNQDGGTMRFEQLEAMMTEIVHQEANGGLQLDKYQLDDTDGGGWDAGVEWSKQMGAYMAYWPQKQVSRFLKEGHIAQTLIAGSNGRTQGFTAYDGLAFFAKNHPVNPFRPAAGTFANLLMGTAGSTPSTDLNDAIYPGGCPIHAIGSGNVTLDVALDNLARVFAYITSLKMPNGEDPRYLHPQGIICSPTLGLRVGQMMDAKFIGMAATGGTASTDISGRITRMGYAEPIVAAELAGFESDSSYFVVAKEMQASEMGGVIYTEREPFSISFYDGKIDADLDRIKKLEWHVSGRNSVAPGHPYHIFKVSATTTD